MPAYPAEGTLAKTAADITAGAAVSVILVGDATPGNADMTFGSRFAGLSDPLGGGMPMYRFLGNRLTTTLENLMLGSRFTDMHSGMRAYTRDCLLSLPFLRYSDGFSFDSQLLVDAVTGGQRVVEVPIPTRYTQESSSISVARSLEYVAHSLAYCARQAAARGRRGQRSPLGAPPPASSAVRPASSPSTTTSSNARAAGWSARCPRSRPRRSSTDTRTSWT